MGTNFYWISTDPEQDRSDDIRIHIGKRSMAGKYCYECGTTLCAPGSRSVHETSYSFGRGSMTVRWHETCPSCDKAVTTGACSFTWTLMQHLRTAQDLARTIPDQAVIMDEYGREYTALAFLAELEGCPIQFQHAAQFS